MDHPLDHTEELPEDVGQEIDHSFFDDQPLEDFQQQEASPLDGYDQGFVSEEFDFDYMLNDKAKFLARARLQEANRADPRRAPKGPSASSSCHLDNIINRVAGHWQQQQPFDVEAKAEQEYKHAAGPLATFQGNYFSKDDYEARQELGMRKGPTTKTCEYCGLFLRHPSKISAHIRTHTGEKPFVCTICGQDFSQRTPYRMHLKRHTGDLPHKCSFCAKKFPNKASRNGHEQRVHKPIQGLAKSVPQRASRSPIVHWPPPIGEIRTPSETALRKITSIVEAVATGHQPGPIESHHHRVDTHRQRSPTVAQCADCGLVFKHPSKIQAHMRTHSGEKPFLCAHCGLGCSTNSALRVHIRRFHTGERPHECTWECGMRFVSVAARNEHERIVHAGIKRYQCTVGECRRLFTRRSYLMKHLNKDHTDQLEENQAIQNVDYSKLNSNGHPTERKAPHPSGIDEVQEELKEPSADLFDEHHFGGEQQVILIDERQMPHFDELYEQVEPDESPFHEQSFGYRATEEVEEEEDVFHFHHQSFEPSNSQP